MFDHQTLQQIVIDVCNTMLDLGVNPVDSQADLVDSTVATIRIGGVIEALVEVETTEGLSRQIATAMFDSTTPTADDIQDALKETVNMVGGNIKGMVPGESQLSLPEIGSRCEEIEPADLLNQVTVHFSAQNESIVVRLFELKTTDVTIP